MLHYWKSALLQICNACSHQVHIDLIDAAVRVLGCLIPDTLLILQSCRCGTCVVPMPLPVEMWVRHQTCHEALKVPRLSHGMSRWWLVGIWQHLCWDCVVGTSFCCNMRGLHYKLVWERLGSITVPASVRDESLQFTKPDDGADTADHSPMQLLQSTQLSSVRFPPAGNRLTLPC